MKKLYDVYFTPMGDGIITIEASDGSEAEEILETEISTDELIERIRDAIEFYGVKVTHIVEVD